MESLHIFETNFEMENSTMRNTTMEKLWERLNKGGFKIKIEGGAVGVVLLGWSSGRRRSGDIHANSSASKQAFTSRLLRPLFFRAHKYDNLLDNSWNDLLAREEERKIK